MTEADWLASNDPAAMLAYLTSTGKRGEPCINHPVATDRKLRLFACACCRAVWDGAACGRCEGRGYFLQPGAWKERRPMTKADKCSACRGTGRAGGLTDPRSRAAVETAERYADGAATSKERGQAMNSVDNIESPTLHYLAAACVRSDADVGAREVVEYIWQDLLPLAAQTALLRDIVGNPFIPTLPLNIHPGWFDILTSGDNTIRAIAENAYDDRCPADALAVLADALEEAGCTEEALLRHLRGPGPHVRGCWAVDLILGKD
jgi:hypothetical protein